MTTNANGVAAINDYPAKTTLNHADDFSAVSTGATSPVAHPACTMACTGQFERGLNFQEMFHGAGIIAPGARNAKDVAAATLAEKRVFSRPEFMSLGLGVSIPQGRQHGDIHVSTPSPIRLSRKQASGFKSHVGANQMATANTTPTPTSGNNTHDHHNTDLFFQASNHLAQAVHSLRHATDDQGIKKAAGRANAAARALNRLVTAYSTKRKQVELVRVTDPRVARYFPETSGGLCGEPDSHWLLAIGRKCTDQQLERFAQREGFPVAELIAFRDSLEVASE